MALKVQDIKVSIIMNCFNSDTYLSEALNSVLAQKYQNWEVIFWDNLSTDSSATIFKSYKEPRFKYFIAENHTSLGEARIRAINMASADWIAFLDCDDIWDDTKLLLQIETLHNDPEDVAMVYTRTKYFTNGGLLKPTLTEGDYPSGEIFRDLACRNFISLSSALVRKACYFEVGGFNPIFKQAEEYDLFLKLAKNFRVLLTDEYLVWYRIHSENLSFTQKDLAFEESIASLESFSQDCMTRKGLRYWSSLYMISSIKNGGNILKAFNHFRNYGGIIEVVRLLLQMIGNKAF